MENTYYGIEKLAGMEKEALSKKTMISYATKRIGQFGPSAKVKEFSKMLKPLSREETKTIATKLIEPTARKAKAARGLMEMGVPLTKKQYVGLVGL